MIFEHKIILFDGVCNFCNSSVNFIIAHDKKNIFKFTPLQSDKGKGLLKKYNLDTTDNTTLILIDGDKVYTKSTAVLTIAKELNGLCKLSYLLILIPPFIRNLVYDLISRFRYKWFGERESCRTPNEQEKNKFL